jgi:putative oxidoreductase
MNDILDLIARIFLAFLFLFEGVDSILFYDATMEKMTKYGLTFQQDIFLVGSTILLLWGGIFLLIGYRASFAAILLLIYWAPLTFIIHSFWNDPVEIRRIQTVLFMKNIAIIGGLLMVVVNGSGKYSIKRLLDNRRLRKRDF